MGANIMHQLATATALFVALTGAAFGQDVRRINTCFEQFLAPLALPQLEAGIGLCDQIINDKATPDQRRGEAFAQRGLMYARRWAILSITPLALQGISDLSEALRLHNPPMERRHQLLYFRATLFSGVGQMRRASADYATILVEDPTNTAARIAQERIGSQPDF